MCEDDVPAGQDLVEVAPARLLNWPIHSEAPLGTARIPTREVAGKTVATLPSSPIRRNQLVR